MSKLIVSGERTLSGKVRLSGNKNSALKLIAASLLSDTPTTLVNMPRITDVSVMCEIVKDLGAKVEGVGTNKIRIDPSGVNKYIIKKGLSGRIRTAPLLIAPLLLRFGCAQISTPGGCSIGKRLLSTHFSLLKSMGAKITKKGDGYFIKFNPKPRFREVFLEEASVTATELGLLLASGIKSETIILDAACEPHVEDLALMLTKMGARIEGAGTNSIKIVGAGNLKGTTHEVIPDYIEAGTWAIASAITHGNVKIEGVRKEDLRMICCYFDHLNIKYSFPGENIWEIKPSNLRFDGQIKEFQTRPWPGFPTDLMSPLIVAATQAEGQVVCHDWMFEWRIFFVDDLISMGAKIIIADPHRVFIVGPVKLRGAEMISKDIRAGMAIVLAALAARGKSVIDNFDVIERGYEDLELKLTSLGAEVEKR